MKNKFGTVACENLTDSELQLVKGGFPILVVALVLIDVAVVGLAVTGAFQMGFDKGRAEANSQNP